MKSTADSPVMATITKIVQETPTVKTYTIEYTLNSAPGQFVMVWVPGVDQKPLSIAHDAGDSFELSIAAVGKATEAMDKFKEGDQVGITGPYGTAYTHEPKNHIVTVAGGYGAAPLSYLAQNAMADDCEIDFIVGARTKEDILFEDRMTKAGANVHVTTDDGSHGTKGIVTDALKTVLEERKAGAGLDNTVVYTCGPELMQKAVAEVAQECGVPSQVSVERYMKCGFGICGNCAVDKEGLLMCKQGPVISGEQALGVEEFGKYHRDKTGVSHDF